MNGTTLRSLDTLRGPSAADIVYAIYRRIVELELPPGSRLSEQEVARQMRISRQPVHDAFAQQEAAVAADDRIRFHVLDDAFHRTICEASGHARDGDPDRAADAMRNHLGRIVDIIAQVRQDHPGMFVEIRR